MSLFQLLAKDHLPGGYSIVLFRAKFEFVLRRAFYWNTEKYYSAILTLIEFENLYKVEIIKR